MTESNVPVIADEVRILNVPDVTFGPRSISKVPASDAGPVTATAENVLLESISICTRLPRALLITSAECRVRLPRVSVSPMSGEIVPELTKTSPVKVPIPLNVPLCELRPVSLQTEMGAVSICPFTLKFALLIRIAPG